MNTYRQIAKDQYLVIREDGEIARMTYNNEPIVFTKEQVDRAIAWRAQHPQEVTPQKVKGVVDNRARNWRRRAY